MISQMPKLSFSTITVSDADRFWLYVDVRGEDECWPWLGPTSQERSGKHGRFQVGKKNVGAHQVAFLLQKGELDSDLEVCHNCSNSICQNGEHLRQDTHLGNMKDVIGRVRKRGEEHGNSKLNWERVHYIRSKIPRHKQPQYVYQEVADELGIAWRTVWKVASYCVWKESDK